MSISTKGPIKLTIIGLFVVVLFAIISPFACQVVAVSIFPFAVCGPLLV